MGYGVLAGQTFVESTSLRRLKVKCRPRGQALGLQSPFPFQAVNLANCRAVDLGPENG